MTLSWRLAARAGATAVATIAALALLPSVLRAPEPPPLDPDVGLLPSGGTQIAAVEEPVGRPAVERRARTAAREDQGEPAHRDQAPDRGEDDGGRAGHPRPAASKPGPSPATDPAPDPDPVPVPAAPAAPVPTPPPATVPEPEPLPPPPEPEPSEAQLPPQSHSPGVQQFGP